MQLRQTTGQIRNSVKLLPTSAPADTSLSSVLLLQAITRTRVHRAIEGTLPYCSVRASLLQDKIKAWAQGAGVQGDLAAICRDPKTNDFLLKDLTATGKEGKLKVGTWCGTTCAYNVHISLVSFDGLAAAKALARDGPCHLVAALRNELKADIHFMSVAGLRAAEGHHRGANAVLHRGRPDDAHLQAEAAAATEEVPVGD